MLVLTLPWLDYFPGLFAPFSVVSSSRGINSHLRRGNITKHNWKVATAEERIKELVCINMSIIKHK